MPLYFIREDITKMNTDAIVLPANPKLEQGSGTSKAIYSAAGESKLKAELKLLYPDGCEIGKAVVTRGYELPAKWIIHAVCPQWLGGDQGEKGFLEGAYRESLKIAKSKKLKSIAFPLLSTGNYKFPRIAALRIAFDTILDFVALHDMDVYLVFFTKEGIADGQKLFGEIPAYIDDDYSKRAYTRNLYYGPRTANLDSDDWYEQREAYKKALEEKKTGKKKTASLSFLIKYKDETFREMLLRLVAESGKKDSQIYHRANVSKQLYSKIKQQPGYMPSKRTILTLAFALELRTETAEELLMKAGYAFSDSDDFDIVMRYCFDRQIYRFSKINKQLKEYNLEDKRFQTEYE